MAPASETGWWPAATPAKAPANCAKTRCLQPPQQCAAPVSCTTARSTATHGFSGADEGTHEFTLDLWRDLVYIDSLPAKESPCVLDIVNARGVDVDVGKTSLRQLRNVFVILKRTGDTSNPQQHALPHFFRCLAAHDHIGNGEAATRL